MKKAAMAVSFISLMRLSKRKLMYMLLNLLLELNLLQHNHILSI